MYNRKSLWLLLLLSIPFAGLKAERVFVLFDENCMDRLEYKQLGQPASYVVYQVNVAPGERLVLEVGQESGEYRGNMPSPMIGCSTGIFDSRMVANINRGIDEVFVVRPLPNGRHTITQVSMAGEYQYNQRVLAFDSPKYAFRFDRENGMIGENIAEAGGQREVYFEGRMEEQCLGAYIFRQFAPRSAKPHLDLVFIPEIGVTEEKSGFTLDEALSNSLKLESVNGLPLAARIAQICNQTVAGGTAPMVLSPYGTEVTPATVYDQEPDMVIKRPVEAANSAPAQALNTAAGPERHTIAKGETLYRISKQYGVSVADLKKWNGLKSNTIYAGKALIVRDPSVAAAAAPGSADMPEAGSARSMPAPYSDSGQRLTTSVKSGTDAREYHTVRTGETVASIAMKYGFTEAKLREMNNLKPNEYPKIGQPLLVDDCDCPDQVPADEGRWSSRGINPYAANQAPASGAAAAPSSSVVSSPVNNYSYPSPDSYEENGRMNTNTRPFSSYTDIPVPATGTMTAPNNYGSGTASPANQPAGYNYYGNNTTVRGTASYGNTGMSSGSGGVKRSHMVKDGETLYDIARQYGTTVQQLRQFNRMEPNEVVIPNQRIYLE